MATEAEEPNDQIEALGAAIRAQRKLANLSLRQLAGIAEISNPYLSQIERGLHAPSVHVLRSIARALSLSAEALQEQAGVIGEEMWTPGSGEKPLEETELAIRRDRGLTDEQKAALLGVYRSYRESNSRSGVTAPAPEEESDVRPPSRRSVDQEAPRQRGGGQASRPRRPKRTGA